MLTLALLWSFGCSSMDYSDARFDRFRDSEAGEVVLDSLMKQGYLDWAGERGITFNLRSMTIEGSSRLVTVEKVSCDIENDGIRSQGNEGAVMVVKTYKDGEYRELHDGEALKDPRRLANGRRLLLLDYFSLAVPFLVADRSLSLESKDSETIGGVLYKVIEVRFQPSGHFPPDEVYRLYYSYSTKRLEKVFFTAGGGEYKGLGIWCEVDNFAATDHVFLPVHRTFTVVPEGSAEKASQPFLEQWVYEVSFGSVGL